MFADEPTGSLDSITAERVMDAMVETTSEIGAALLVVTHDNVVASHFERHVVMSDGWVDESATASAGSSR